MLERIPRTKLKPLRGTTGHVLEIILAVMKVTPFKDISGSEYCIPSQRWIASRLVCSRETVSRSVTRLSKLGLIHVIHRRKVRGRWQTNLYKLGQELCKIIYGIKKATRNLLHRVTVSSHIENKPKLEKKPNHNSEAHAPPIHRKTPLIAHAYFTQLATKYQQQENQ